LGGNLLKINRMRKLFVLTICFAVLGICSTQAQEKSEKTGKKAEIPAAVKSAFQVKYPKAEKIEWGVEKPGEFEAEFILNKIESSAVFDSKGQFIESETEIMESELPQPVKATIAKDFAGYKLREIAKSTDAKGGITYEMNASMGREKVEISFDANGKLLEKEAANGEKEKN
jgi:hypothetical protein